ncbi:MAG: GIY-YIG nuclease family protein [Microcoleus sp. SIO2G3]|nr:GIY-YIG nuclease family protein [Microcoleus sp. SIO2G3]
MSIPSNGHTTTVALENPNADCHSENKALEANGLDCPTDCYHRCGCKRKLRFALMYPALDFAKLPFVLLPQRDRLPCCAAIYFAIDSNDRILYVGQASNLHSRWQGHHRLDQLLRIHKRTPVRLHWLDCRDRLGELDAIEAFYIQHYHPLLNRTQVPAKKIVPAEAAMQETLLKIAKYSIIFGMAPAGGERPLPTVNIRYFGSGRTVNMLRSIFKASNRKPTGLQWTEFVKRKWSAWWRTKCNGVAIELGYWSSSPETTQQLRDGASVQPLAGVEMLALQPMQLEALILEAPFLAQNYPGMTALAADPIPLLWTPVQQP